MTISALLRQTLAQALAPQWRPLALATFLLLGVTNAVMALHEPAPGEQPDIAFSIAGAIRAIGVVSLGVAFLRVGAGSRRRTWAFDAGFFLYFAISLAEFAVTFVAVLLVRDLAEGWQALVRHIAAFLLLAPLAPWMVAAAVERPLAWRPAPWFRYIGDWLPAFLVLSIPLALIATAHALLTLRLLELPEGPLFWRIALLDAAVTTAMVLLTLALRLAAYRDVARG